MGVPSNILYVVYVENFLIVFFRDRLKSYIILVCYTTTIPVELYHPYLRLGSGEKSRIFINKARAAHPFADNLQYGRVANKIHVKNILTLFEMFCIWTLHMLINLFLREPNMEIVLMRYVFFIVNTILRVDLETVQTGLATLKQGARFYNRTVNC